ncbi:MAG TPA: hypothetical protein VFX30_01945 [bacterium]|nr:hypothetical protein [bacterium]
MTRSARLLTAAAMLLVSSPVFAGATAGTLTHPKATVALKYSYFVKGPDGLDPKKTIRRLIFTSADIGAKIQACTTMSCVDGTLTEGVMVDLDQGSRLNYWMVLNGGLVQYSGTTDVANLKTTTDQPKALAGKLTFDDSGMGGPKVDATFDDALLKEFTQAR